MPRGVKKENLPWKVCVVCNRPYNWRKKWERCWDEVTTCSKACNATRRQLKGSVSAHSDDDESAAHGEETGAVGDADDVKQQRKAAAKAAKAVTRAKRECSAPAETGQKLCDICGKGSDLLVRCQTDATQAWRMVCGKCWTGVSGGQVDGDSSHPHYRYGGLWKNRKAAVAAVPRSVLEDAADHPSSKHVAEAARPASAQALPSKTADAAACASRACACDDARSLQFLPADLASLRL
jgi:hypothetical protein